MKKLLLIIFILGFANVLKAQDNKEVIRLSEPVTVTESYEVYGSALEEPKEVSTLSEVLSAMKDENEKVISTKASIAEVCEKKGCFFVAQDGDMTARITFKDYAFFIPTDSQGKEVTIVGTLSKKVLTEEKAKHYAEDAGKNADEVIGEQVEYSIVATSIFIKKEV